MSVYRPATKTQLAQISDICRRRDLPTPRGLATMTREEGDRLVRALLYIDGDRDLEPDLELVHQLEASREEKPMAEETKTCNECGETKPSTDYYKGSAKCKPCYLQRQKDRDAARKARKTKRRAESVSKPEPEVEPEVAFTPADEDLDLDVKGSPEKAPGPHWCLAELRDPRLSTVRQAQKVFESVFDREVSLDTAALVLVGIADLDLT